jgi:uncharacterized protein (TIGR00251 family)
VELDSIISVRVIPRAASSKVDGRRGDAWLVRLRTPPVDGAANAELITVLAAALDVPKREISIVSGDRSRLKRVRIGGLDAETVAARLAELR